MRRRTFLQLAAGGALAVPALARSTVRRWVKPEKLRIAMVGTANRAWDNLQAVSGEQIVALCDVDSGYLARASGAFPDAKAFRDYREMLSSNVAMDAVLVATPDHTHAPASAMAMRAGKHVYCEKPLTHTVAEARLLTELAREKGLATQMGTQIHAGNNYRRVVELIQSGAIGDVQEAHVWCGKSWSDGRYAEAKPAPETLDWNLWLGAAPEHAYCDGIHPASWRKFWAYGTGTLGDMACHYGDLVFWALGIDYPHRIEAWGPEVHPDGAPRTLRVRWDFASGPGGKPFTMWWHDGGPRPEILSKLTDGNGSPLQWGDGQLFIGETGMIISDYDNHRLLRDNKVIEFTPPSPTIPASIGHHAEWIRACKEGSPTTCHFGYAGPLTETVLLGSVAYRAGGPIEWDARALRVTNSEAAQKLISKVYREGFSV